MVVVPSVLCHERRGMPAARRCATIALVLLVAGITEARLPSNQPDPDFRPYLLSTVSYTTKSLVFHTISLLIRELNYQKNE